MHSSAMVLRFAKMGAAAILGAFLADLMSLAWALGEENVTLGIDLQEGFRSEEVEILLDGEVVFTEPEVTTTRMLGVAKSIRLDVSPGVHKLVVFLPRRGLRHEIPLDIRQDYFVGVSLVNGAFELFRSTTPFGYG